MPVIKKEPELRFCEECGTVFEVDASTINIKNGHLPKCPNCGSAFLIQRDMYQKDYLEAASKLHKAAMNNGKSHLSIYCCGSKSFDIIEATSDEIFNKAKEVVSIAKDLDITDFYMHITNIPGTAIGEYHKDDSAVETLFKLTTTADSINHCAELMDTLAERMRDKCITE